MALLIEEITYAPAFCFTGLLLYLLKWSRNSSVKGTWNRKKGLLAIALIIIISIFLWFLKLWCECLKGLTTRVWDYVSSGLYCRSERRKLETEYPINNLWNDFLDINLVHWQKKFWHLQLRKARGIMSSYVKSKVHYVTILYNVLFPFNGQPSGLFTSLLRLVSFVIQ